MARYQRPYNYNELKNLAGRIEKMRRAHAQQLCREAGLDPSLLGIHPHNAMVSLHYGKPWPEVNYSKCRACIRQMDRMFDADKILDALYSRIGRENFTWGEAK